MAESVKSPLNYEVLQQSTKKPKEQSVFTKHLPNVKLATRFDSDGNEIQVEKREDEEQTVRQQEIFDILVAAGYFRARIKGLSAFDKVVGGMTWCIEASDYDVDVDLLFHENLIIGQKIALTEKIVTVLPRMKCPYVLEPHQIQGLDFISIYPVIQWLVKKSVETRAQRAESLKTIALNEFSSHFQFQSDKDHKAHVNSLADSIKRVEKYRLPKRIYKRVGDLGDEDEQTKVRITLLEYGEEGNVLCGPKKDPEDLPEDEPVDIEHLLTNLNITEDDQNFSPLTMNEEDKLALKRHYEDFHQEMEIDAKELSAQSHLKTLIATKTALEKKLKRILDENQEFKDEFEHLQAVNNEFKAKEDTVKAEIANLDEIEKNGEKKLLNEIQDLVKKNEELKKEESKYKEYCRLEMARLQQEILDAESQAPPTDISECQELLETEQKKLSELRLLYAKRNRQITVIQRQLDNIPDRAELAQYQRRFLELYNQVSSKHKETKQFFALYNTLDDTKRYIEKELNLLNSIYESYYKSMQNSHSREDFLKQFESIVEGVNQTLTKVRQKCNDEKGKRDALNGKFMALLDVQRKYAAAIKQLTKDCQRCEALSLHLKSIQ